MTFSQLIDQLTEIACKLRDQDDGECAAIIERALGQVMRLAERREQVS